MTSKQAKLDFYKDLEEFATDDEKEHIKNQASTITNQSILNGIMHYSQNAQGLNQ